MSWENRISGTRICLYLNSGWHDPQMLKIYPMPGCFHLPTWKRTGRYDVKIPQVIRIDPLDEVGKVRCRCHVNGGMVFSRRCAPRPGQLLQKISRMPWTFHTFETENVNSWDLQFCQVSPLQVAEKFTLTLKKVRGVKEFPPIKNPKPLSYFLQVWVHAIGDFSGYPRST